MERRPALLFSGAALLLMVQVLGCLFPPHPIWSFRTQGEKPAISHSNIRLQARVPPSDFKSEALIFGEFPHQEIPPALSHSSHIRLQISLACAPNSKSFGSFSYFFLFCSFSMKNCLHEFLWHRTGEPVGASLVPEVWLRGSLMDHACSHEYFLLADNWNMAESTQHIHHHVHKSIYF